MTPHRRNRAAEAAAGEAVFDDHGDDLSFCANCQVSVAQAEIDAGTAARTPRGRVFCPACFRATPEERRRRRDLLESEFADDAPVRRRGSAGMPNGAAQRPAPASTPSAPSTPTPASAPAKPDLLAVLEARVGELERAAFRMQARISHLEEALARADRVPG